MLYEVRANDKSGYIDSRGEIIVPIDADSCIEFGDKRGGVCRDRLLEIVDQQGIVIGASTDVFPCGSFAEDRLVAIDRSGRAANLELRAGYLDPSGAWAIEPKFRQVSKYCGGVAIASTSYGKNKHWEGLIDRSGHWIGECRFEKIYRFGREVNVTVARQDPTRDGLCCVLIDKAGNQVGNESYEKGKSGNEGLVPVVRNGKFGCVDENGRVVIPFVFENLNCFSEGLASAENEAGLVGVIDKHGHWIVQPSFLDVGSFREGLAPAQVCEAGVIKWGYINRDGDWAIPPRFEEAYEFVEGIAEVIPLGHNPDRLEDVHYMRTDGVFIWQPS